MQHITGHAPFVRRGHCVLTGCKINTVEVWASAGSWVMAVGGNKTGNPDRIIYVMLVDQNISFRQFAERYHRYADIPFTQGKRVLLSREFLYFGEQVKVELPQRVKHIMVKTQGCKRISQEDIEFLYSFLRSRYSDKCLRTSLESFSVCNRSFRKVNKANRTIVCPPTGN